MSGAEGACPESDRRVKQGEVVGTLAPAVARRASAGVPSTRLRAASLWDRAGLGRNGAGKSTLPSASDRRSALRARLKILSRITEPTSGRAETCVDGGERVRMYLMWYT